jgi:putative DNA primase/helicase
MTIIPQPTPATIARLSNFPAKQRSQTIWLNWSTEPRVNQRGEIRITKVPYCSRTGQLASCNKPATWSSHKEAVKAWKHGWNCRGKRYDGVGIALDQLVGVDLDGCLRPDGALEDWAQEMIDELASYAEWSPNRGGHIIVAGAWPFPEHQKNLIPGREHYGPAFFGAGSARYFTVTGNVIGRARPIAERTRELKAIHDRLWPEAKLRAKRAGRASPAGPAPVAQPLDISDQELIRRAIHARDGGRFGELWQGVWKGRYASHSEADYHLCLKLSFWTGRDAGRIRRLFLSSRLVRTDKCIERRDYLENTIRNAILATGAIYQPRERRREPETSYAERLEFARREWEREEFRQWRERTLANLRARRDQELKLRRRDQYRRTDEQIEVFGKASEAELLPYFRADRRED